MTGFGVGESLLGSGRIFVEARSVNHRFLDVRVRLPKELGEHGTFLEQLARSKLTRGRLEISVRFDGPASGALVLDRRRAFAAMRALMDLRDELGLSDAVPLSLLASVPDLFVNPSSEDPENARRALAASLEVALTGLEKMRVAEGANLHADLRERLRTVRSLATEITGFASELSERYRKRLGERVARLLEGREHMVDKSRLELEIALIADHSDVTEELTRLSSHCGQFAQLLEPNDPAGRRMDFLLQEMAREVNTIGSKSSEADVGLRVVELKAELERMREQVQNVE